MPRLGEDHSRIKFTDIPWLSPKGNELCFDTQLECFIDLITGEKWTLEGLEDVYGDVVCLWFIKHKLDLSNRNIQ